MHETERHEPEQVQRAGAHSLAYANPSTQSKLSQTQNAAKPIKKTSSEAQYAHALSVQHQAVQARTNRRNRKASTSFAANCDGDNHTVTSQVKALCEEALIM